VQQEPPDRFDVVRIRAFEVGFEEHVHREVQDVVHVGQPVRVEGREVHDDRADPGVGQPFPGLRSGEPGQAPHLVVGGERGGQRRSDRAARARDENSLAREHGQPP
jgi:hypothetical protein